MLFLFQLLRNFVVYLYRCAYNLSFMSSWFETWFDSPYYHLLYRHRNDAEATTFVDALFALLQPPAGSAILDLACGKGRHARHIAQMPQYYQVTGMDLAANSIAEARRQNHTLPNLRFAVGDMRQAHGTDCFDYVFNFFTSFGYFDNRLDNRRTVAAVAQMLRPNGFFTLDFLNIHKIKATLIPYEEQQIEDVRFVIRRSITDGYIVKNISVYTPTSKEALQFEERVQALSCEDIATYFEQENLSLVDVFGNYQLLPYDSSTSDRCILIGKK